VGTESVADYCRQVEAYLCQKNDGHLIRVVGPSFDLVSKWASDGVPLKVAFKGIDRYVERYYRRGPRRRPVRIDFCEADILDAFDEWRRAVGLVASAAPAGSGQEPPPRRTTSLPAHLERAVMRLSGCRASGRLGPEADALIDDVSRELDAARTSSSGVRGDARRALLERLAILDRELLTIARGLLSDAERRRIEEEAHGELLPYRDSMPREQYERAWTAACDRLVREAFTLPSLTFS
jgi:hypothetical protein